MASEYADSALAAGRAASVRPLLQQAYQQSPGLDLLRALARLEGTELASLPQTLAHLRQWPSLSAAQAVLARPRRRLDRRQRRRRGRGRDARSPAAAALPLRGLRL